MEWWQKIININLIALESLQMRAEHWLLTQVLVPSTLAQVPALIVAFGLAWLLAKPVCRRINRRFESGYDWMDRTLRLMLAVLIPLISPLIAMAVLGVAIVVAEEMGWPNGLVGTALTLLGAWVVIRLMTSLIASAFWSRVIALVAWGLAALYIVGLLGPTILLLDKSIKPGDVIEVGNTFGWVAGLSARYVAISTRDGKDWLIPNEDLITHRVTNWSYTSGDLRLPIRMRVSFQSDLRRTMELSVEAAMENPRVLKRQPPVCRIVEFGKSSVHLELRIWISDPQNGIYNVRSDVMLGIWERFRANNIQTPFPQRDLHIKGAQAIPVVVQHGNDD